MTMNMKHHKSGLYDSCIYVSSFLKLYNSFVLGTEWNLIMFETHLHVGSLWKEQWQAPSICGAKVSSLGKSD